MLQNVCVAEERGSKESWLLGGRLECLRSKRLGESGDICSRVQLTAVFSILVANHLDYFGPFVAHFGLLGT